MALMDFLTKQFIDIIQSVDDTRDTLSYRFPDEDKEIKRGAQLIVRESQTCQFIYLGQFGDTFGPGKHTLVTENIPILSPPSASCSVPASMPAARASVAPSARPSSTPAIMVWLTSLVR